MNISNIFELNSCYKAAVLVTIFIGIIIGQLIYINTFSSIPEEKNTNDIRLKALQKKNNFRYDKLN